MNPQGRKTFLRKSLGIPSGEIGPVVLYFERQEREGCRAENKLLGGIMGVWPIGLQESLCVEECREGDSNPHRLIAHQALNLARLPVPPSRRRQWTLYHRPGILQAQMSKSSDSAFGSGSVV